jgi:hypothetical protein
VNYHDVKRSISDITREISEIGIDAGCPDVEISVDPPKVAEGSTPTEASPVKARAEDFAPKRQAMLPTAIATGDSGLLWNPSRAARHFGPDVVSQSVVEKITYRVFRTFAGRGGSFRVAERS